MTDFLAGLPIAEILGLIATAAIAAITRLASRYVGQDAAERAARALDAMVPRAIDFALGQLGLTPETAVGDQKQKVVNVAAEYLRTGGGGALRTLGADPVAVERRLQARLYEVKASAGAPAR